MLKCLSALVVLATLVGTVPSVARAGGEEVVVIFNRRVFPDSRLVADHYARRRAVPDSHVIGLDLPQTESMTRTEYTDQLLKPLFRELEAREFLKVTDEIVPATRERPGQVRRRVSAATIRYLVLCYGVPVRIDADPTLNEPASENIRPELRRNDAAVDTELALLPRLFDQPPHLTGIAPNPFWAATNRAILHPINGALLVTRLDGPSAHLARGLVDKALEAEAVGLWGRAYFDVRGLTNGPYKLGDDWIRSAYLAVRRQGFESVLDEKPEVFPASFPLSHVAIYAGWYEGTACGPFAQPKVEFMPGAIAYHLHSYSAANVRSPVANWVGPLVAKGVTATLGAVNEPYLTGTPDVGGFFSRLLYLGFTFGEAAYAAIPGLSWQITVIGDPLYRPFGKPAQQLHEDLERRHDPLLEWSHLRVVNLNLITGLPPEDLLAYLEHLSLTRESSVLQEKVGDLYLAQGRLGYADEAYERALRLRTSPPQRLRLLLRHIELLRLRDKEADAVAAYVEFIRDFPDYPELLTLCQKALPLAQKAGKTAEVEQIQKQIARLTPKPAGN